MQVIVQSKSLTVTSALRSFIRQQAEKLSKVGRVTQLHVFLEKVSRKDNDPTAASVQYFVQIPGRQAVVVRRRAVDMYDAIVDATDRAFRQLRKVKEKRISKKRVRVAHKDAEAPNKSSGLADLGLHGVG